MIKRWIRRHPVAFIITILVLLLSAFLTDECYRAEFCPLCGHATMKTGIRVVGIPIMVSRTKARPCLTSKHRLFLTGASWSFWWKDGYTHATGSAWMWPRSYRFTLGPWLKARPPSDHDRKRVLAALEQASFEQLDALLGEDRYFEFMQWENIAELLEPPHAGLAERWGTEFLMPWTDRAAAR